MLLKEISNNTSITIFVQFVRDELHEPTTQPHKHNTVNCQICGWKYEHCCQVALNKVVKCIRSINICLIFLKHFNSQYALSIYFQISALSAQTFLFSYQGDYLNYSNKQLQQSAPIK